MDQKITITKEEVELADEHITKDTACDSVKDDKSPSFLSKTLLFPLVLLFPLLCFIAIIIRLAQNKENDKKAIRWITYCNTLLIISGLTNIAFAVLCYEVRYDFSTKVLKPNSVFVLNTNKEFSNTYSHDELKTKDLAKKVEDNIFITSKASKWSKPSKRQLLEAGFGTSFLIYANKNDCLLVTCRHVIDGEEWESEKPFKGDVALWDRKDGYAIGKVIGRHKTLDLLLIDVKRDPNLKEVSFVQPILDSNKTEMGEHVMIYGHPEGLFFSLADGLISRKDNKGILQITAPVSPGDSGGPVYNFHGQLVGIVSSMLDKSINKNSENLNFAVTPDSLVKIDDWNLNDNGKSLVNEYIQKEIKEQKTNN